MKACLLRNPAPVQSLPLTYEDRPVPVPVRNQILVRVRACAVCRTDLHIVEGELPVRQLPVIPGHQIVGLVEAMGREANRFRAGDRVGIPWLNQTCGACRHCLGQSENLCDAAIFTGYTVNGGYAEYAVVPEDFAYELPDALSDVQAAPLLCAGIIGFRSLRLSGVLPGGRLGLYGFGAAGHIVIQIARAQKMEVYVCTRDARHQDLAQSMGADWVSGKDCDPPVALDGAIIFAPAGEIVASALQALDKGGTLVLGGIHMSDIPALPYSLLYHERVLRSVANNTRQDGEDLLRIASSLPLRTTVEVYPLTEANRALIALKNDQIRGAAVLAMG